MIGLETNIPKNVRKISPDRKFPVFSPKIPPNISKYPKKFLKIYLSHNFFFQLKPFKKIKRHKHFVRYIALLCFIHDGMH